MMLRLFNSKKGEKEPFKPLDKTHIKLYVCGPTVYDFVHIGNAFSAVSFDVLFRLLRASYPQVTYVRNITDVDDRINEIFRKTGEPIASITERYTQAYQAHMQMLGCLAPSLEPKATDYIAAMISTIKRLLDNGHAYAAEEHVLFHVPSHALYGELSNRPADVTLAAARIEQAPYKKHPSDFVLWKPSTDDLPGWESPWGRGRPGWHLECTAMVHSSLGTEIDIHGGGRDLQFPHHENELAQSRCLAPNSCYAKLWLHNGLLQTNNGKMSKSRGDFITVQALLKKWDGETLRYAILSGHYRGNLDWSENLLKQSKSSLDRLQRALAFCPEVAVTDETLPCPGEILDTLRDDLNTPEVLAILHSKAGELFQKPDAKTTAKLARELKGGAQFLGLCQQTPQARFQSSTGTQQSLLPEKIASLIALRNSARQAKDFAKADALRNELESQGVVIEDSEKGTQWRYQAPE